MCVIINFFFCDEYVRRIDCDFTPSGKSAPMSASAATSSKRSANHNPNFDMRSHGPLQSTRSFKSIGESPTDGHDSLFESSMFEKPHDFSDLCDIFGGSSTYTSKSKTHGANSVVFNFDSMFGGSSDKDGQVVKFGACLR